MARAAIADGQEAVALSGFAIWQDAPAPAQVAGVNIQAADARGAGNGFGGNQALNAFAGMGRVGLGPGDKAAANALGLALVAR